MIPGGISCVTLVSVVDSIAVGAPSLTRATSTYRIAPLTGFQAKSAGEATFVALLAGDTSSAPSLLQFCDSAMVNSARPENVDAHSSKTASIPQITLPGGNVRVSCVSSVTPMSCGSGSSIDAITRYFSAFSTPVQTNVTGDVVTVPCDGVTMAGSSFEQRSVSAIRKYAVDDE